MIYVVSDLYGDWEKYKAVLKEINLKDEDTLFVLGNIVDGGDKGIEILMDMMLHGNIFPILGDHDLVAYEVLSGIEKETRKDFSAPLSKLLAERCRMWTERGGEGTLFGFSKLSDDDKITLLEYMEEFSLYEEVEAGGFEFVLVRNMPEDFKLNDSLENYSAEDILSGGIDYNREYFPDKILVSANDVTITIDRETHGKIFKNDYHVAINCGSSMGGDVAIYCLDTDEEFYV